MGLKGQKTTSEPIEWEKLQLLVLRLERDGDRKFSLLISLGMYLGLRISDILLLKVKDIKTQDFIDIVEKKTKKSRRMTINHNLKEIINRLLDETRNPEEFIFMNRFGTSTLSIQYVNRKLKTIVEKYKVVKDSHKTSTHTLRKSFGKRVYESNGSEEKSLVILSQIFSHSSISTTRLYIGLTDQVISNVYETL